MNPERRLDELPHRFGTRRVAVTVLALSLLAAACGDDGSSSSSTSTLSPATSTVVSTTVAPPTTALPSAPASTSQTATTVAPMPETEVVLAIAPDGLFLVRSANGSTTPFTFGSAQAQVMQSLTAVLGEPTNAGAAFDECPNGEDFAASWNQAIAVSFIDGSLLSWSLRPGSTITDIAGIGLGSTVAELTDVHNVEIAPSTLGIEFHTVGATTTNGYGGLLTGDSANATVTDMWAGSICAFR